MKAFFKLLIFLFLLFFVGCFCGFPVIPWIETHYYIENTNENLKDGVMLKDSIKIQIQDIYPENEQCIDVCFVKTQDSSNTVLKYFDFQAYKTNGHIVKNESIYLFENDDTKEISDLDNLKSNTDVNIKYK